MNEKKVIFSAENVVMDFATKTGNILGKGNTLRALNDISFNLYEGESLAVVGESGCGKSTICKIAMRFYKPTEGEMLFEGKNIHKLKGKELKDYRGKSQMVFQDPFSSLNPIKNIYYHLRRPLQLYHNIPKSKLNEKMNELLEKVGLTPADEVGKKFPHELSGGQKQRVYLARILAIGANVIFADEPTSMLDVSVRIGVLNLMTQMKEAMNKSFIYITIHITPARYFSDRIIVLYAGHMVEWGDVHEVILKPKHPYTQLLIAAAPDPEREEAIDLPVVNNLDAEVTSWSPDKKGCPFKNRCPKATDKCGEAFPKAKEISKNHFVRCTLFE